MCANTFSDVVVISTKPSNKEYRNSAQKRICRQRLVTNNISSSTLFVYRNTAAFNVFSITGRIMNLNCRKDIINWHNSCCSDWIERRHILSCVNCAHQCSFEFQWNGANAIELLISFTVLQYKPFVWNASVNCNGGLYLYFAWQSILSSPLNLRKSFDRQYNPSALQLCIQPEQKRKQIVIYFSAIQSTAWRCISYEHFGKTGQLYFTPIKPFPTRQ